MRLVRHGLAAGAAGAGLLLLALLPGCGGEPAQVDDEPVRVRASVESADVTPGRPFELVVEVDRRTDVTFELPDVGASIEGLILLDMETHDEQVGQRELTRTTYTLRAPRAGTYLIPGVEAPWKTPDLQVGTAGTGPILVEAERAAGEGGSGEEELRDLKPIRKPPLLLWPWIVGGILLTLTLVGLALAFRAWRRRRQPAAPPRPADERALEELAALLASDLLRAADQGPFAYRVSGILRRYLEDRFGFRAWRMTTPEVLRAMPPSLASRRELEAAVREVLEASDRVKFAGQPVEVDELKGWITRASQVVRATRPDPTAARRGASS